jgi:purine-binding chemotaxis protein CheW
MSKQVCTFYLENQIYGLYVLQVREVLRCQELTTIPLAPGAVRGLLNLRGSIVTTVDLRRRLGLPPDESGEPATNVVAQTATGLVSLLVDRIGDVVEVEAEALEPPPGVLPEPLRSLIANVCKLPTGLLLILNLERAMELDAFPA